MGKQLHNFISNSKSLQQVLSIDKKPIAFLLGAGCPLSVEVSDGEWPLIGDIKKITNQIQDRLVDNEKFNTLLCEIDDLELDRDNIEDILSLIRRYKAIVGNNGIKNFDKNDLETLENTICNELSSLLDVSLPDKNTPYHHLANWISSINRPHAVEIFTTNYDLLLEEALEECGVAYFDGFTGGKSSLFDLKSIEENLMPPHHVRLWKIHGSINWYFDSEKICRMSGAKPDEPRLIYPSHLKYDQSRQMPYRAFLNRLESYIKEESSFLIMSGYSFSDQHINNTIINALRSNPTSAALVLLYDKLDSYDHVQDVNVPNLSFWGKDEAIIGTKEEKWGIGQAVDKEGFDEYYLENDEEVNNQLGDFSKLGHLLNSLKAIND
jgi:hypothetical protein